MPSPTLLILKFPLSIFIYPFNAILLVLFIPSAPLLILNSPSTIYTESLPRIPSPLLFMIYVPFSIFKFVLIID